MIFQTELPNRALIQLTGPDKCSFLQGLVTNDMARVSKDRPLYTALLTPQGKFFFDLFVFENEGEWLIDCERDRVLDLIKRLSLYKLRSQISIHDLSDTYKVFGVSDHLEGICIQDPRLKELGYRLYTKGHLESDERYEKHRISLGVPDGSRDIPIDRGVILEYGLDELNAIDWDKGCYIGQELTARTRYRGLIRKRLLPVQIEGALPDLLTPIFLGDEEVGEMRTSFDGLGLALLRLASIRKTFPTLICGNAQLTPYVPSWVRLPPEDN